MLCLQLERLWQLKQVGLEFQDLAERRPRLFSDAVSGQSPGGPRPQELRPECPKRPFVNSILDLAQREIAQMGNRIAVRTRKTWIASWRIQWPAAPSYLLLQRTLAIVCWRSCQ